MKLFTLSTVTDGVPSTEIFAQEDAAVLVREARYRDMWAAHLPDEPYPGDVEEAHSTLCGEDVSDEALMWFEEHEVAGIAPEQMGIRFVELSEVFTLVTSTKPGDTVVAAFGTLDLLRNAAIAFLTAEWASWMDGAPMPTDESPEGIQDALRAAGWPGSFIATAHQLKGQTTIEPAPVPADPGELQMEEHFRQWAKENVHDEGATEIDDAALVSLCPDEETGEIKGAYVQAWVWIAADDVELTTDDMGDCDEDVRDV